MENVTQLAPGTLWTRGVRGRSTDDGTVAGAGGGTGIDTNLTPPVLSLAVAGNVYPPQIDAALDVTWITGDKLRLQSCADISFGTLIIDNLHTITNAEVLAGSISYGALLSGIISPTVTWFRARGEHAAGNSNWSNICLHGDVTAPTITSSAAISVNENTVLAHILTANETIYTWAITGGVDSAQFEIAGTTLRWLGNGTKDYEVPTDSGANNVYDVQVTATDYAGNATNQSIAVTVNDLNEIPTGLSGFFTDVTGATASTLYTSANTYTVAGLATTVPITVSGGTYSKNSAAYTAGAGTTQNGDTVQLQTTSSGSSGGVVDTIITIGGGSDTWRVTTAGPPALPAQGNLLFWGEATDTSNLFQTITGTGAVSADGDPVGTWTSKNSLGFSFVGKANDGTRPLFKVFGSRRRIVFDGVDDVLQHVGAMGMFSATTCTIMVVCRSPASVQGSVIGEGNSGGTTQIYSPIRNVNASKNNSTASIRDNSNTTNFASTTTISTGAFPTNTDVVYILKDNATSMVGVVDGTASSSVPYTRGATTLDQTYFGARWRGAATYDDWMAIEVEAIMVWNKILDSTETATATTYGGYLQGRSI